MKIGVLGSGVVAQVLGAGFLGERHEVVLGTRDPQKLAQWLARNPVGRVGSFGGTGAFGDLVVRAVKGLVALDALRSAGAERLAGKIVIDATNPIADASPVNGVLQFFTGPNESLMERLQLGWDVEDMGGAEAARAIEPLCMLWCIPGFLRKRMDARFQAAAVAGRTRVS